jgi:glycosyltransferase involved in cell wall biosynthesis
MRVAYDPQIFCGQKYGGISRYFCELASRIANNHQVDIKIAAPMSINAYLESLPKRIVSGFRSPLSENQLKLPQRIAGIALGDILLRHMQPDIVHETYYLKYPIGPRKAVRVLTIYDMIHEKFESQFQYGNKTSIHKSIAAKRSDHIICISEHTKKDAIEILGIDPNKISVIHLGFDLTSNCVGEEKVERNINKPYLLYVGSRGGYKNFSTLLEAFATSVLLKSEFRLVCFGGGSFDTQELSLIKSFNLNQEQIIQVSGDDSKLAIYYQQASLFVFPSLYEGFGIPPLEAMSYNCPVVCSNTSSIPEVVGDAGKYFDPNNVKNMQETIEHVIQSPETQNSLINSGKERLKQFSWDKCASETLTTYRSLL